jgi:hypothetical protein
VAAYKDTHCNYSARLENIARLVNIGLPVGDWGPMFDSCSADDWDRLSDGSPEADCDPRFDDLHRALMNLNSRSAPEAGHLVLRESDRGARHRATALSLVLSAAPDAKPAEVLTAEAACYQYPDAAWEQASNAEPASKPAEVCCWDPDAARDSKPPSSR